jgi:hypothetical protein
MQNFTHLGKGGSDYSSDSGSETEPMREEGPKIMRSASAYKSRLPRDIRHGYMAVYVGKERKRFVISTNYLSHRLFKALLKRSEEEYGFVYEGGVAIACEPVLFEHLLWMIGNDDPAAKTTELEDLADFYDV